MPFKLFTTEKEAGKDDLLAAKDSLKSALRVVDSRLSDIEAKERAAIQEKIKLELAKREAERAEKLLQSLQEVVKYVPIRFKHDTQTAYPFPISFATKIEALSYRNANGYREQKYTVVTKEEAPGACCSMAVS